MLKENFTDQQNLTIATFYEGQMTNMSVYRQERSSFSPSSFVDPFLKVSGQSLGSALHILRLNLSTDCSIDEEKPGLSTCTRPILNLDNSSVYLTGYAVIDQSNICDGVGLLPTGNYILDRIQATGGDVVDTTEITLCFSVRLDSVYGMVNLSTSETDTYSVEMHRANNEWIAVTLSITMGRPNDTAITITQGMECVGYINWHNLCLRVEVSGGNLRLNTAIDGHSGNEVILKTEMRSLNRITSMTVLIEGELIVTDINAYGEQPLDLQMITCHSNKEHDLMMYSWDERAIGCFNQTHCAVQTALDIFREFKAPPQPTAVVCSLRENKMAAISCEMQCYYDHSCTGYSYLNDTELCQLYGNYSCLQKVENILSLPEDLKFVRGKDLMVYATNSVLEGGDYRGADFPSFTLINSVADTSKIYNIGYESCLSLTSDSQYSAVEYDHVNTLCYVYLHNQSMSTSELSRNNYNIVYFSSSIDEKEANDTIESERLLNLSPKICVKYNEAVDSWRSRDDLNDVQCLMHCSLDVECQQVQMTTGSNSTSCLFVPEGARCIESYEAMEPFTNTRRYVKPNCRPGVVLYDLQCITITSIHRNLSVYQVTQTDQLAAMNFIADVESVKIALLLGSPGGICDVWSGWSVYGSLYPWVPFIEMCNHGESAARIYPLSLKYQVTGLSREGFHYGDTTTNSSLFIHKYLPLPASSFAHWALVSPSTDYQLINDSLTVNSGDTFLSIDIWINCKKDEKYGKAGMIEIEDQMKILYIPTDTEVEVHMSGPGSVTLCTATVMADQWYRYQLEIELPTVGHSNGLSHGCFIHHYQQYTGLVLHHQYTGWYDVEPHLVPRSDIREHRLTVNLHAYIHCLRVKYSADVTQPVLNNNNDVHSLCYDYEYKLIEEEGDVYEVSLYDNGYIGEIVSASADVQTLQSIIAKNGVQCKCLHDQPRVRIATLKKGQPLTPAASFAGVIIITEDVTSSLANMGDNKVYLCKMELNVDGRHCYPLSYNQNSTGQSPIDFWLVSVTTDTIPWNGWNYTIMDSPDPTRLHSGHRITRERYQSFTPLECCKDEPIVETESYDIRYPMCQCQMINPKIKYDVLDPIGTAIGLPSTYLSDLPCQCPQIVYVDGPCDCKLRYRVISKCVYHKISVEVYEWESPGCTHVGLPIALRACVCNTETTTAVGTTTVSSMSTQSVNSTTSTDSTTSTHLTNKDTVSFTDQPTTQPTTNNTSISPVYTSTTSRLLTTTSDEQTTSDETTHRSTTIQDVHASELTSTPVSTTSAGLPNAMAAVCDCSTGHTVANDSAKDMVVACSHACPYWSEWRDTCNCISRQPHTIESRDCINPSIRSHRYLHVINSLCKRDTRETRTVTNSTDCVCSKAVTVNQCSCADKWGRRGYECHHDNVHPLQHKPVCVKSDVWPYKCGQHCSEYTEEYTEWSVCDPCDVGDELGRRWRYKECSKRYVGDVELVDLECTHHQRREAICICDTEWSHWGPCDCAVGVQKRTRCPNIYPRTNNIDKIQDGTKVQSWTGSKDATTNDMSTPEVSNSSAMSQATTSSSLSESETSTARDVSNEPNMTATRDTTKQSDATSTEDVRDHSTYAPTDNRPLPNSTAFDVTNPVILIGKRAAPGNQRYQNTTSTNNMTSTTPGNGHVTHGASHTTYGQSPGQSKFQSHPGSFPNQTGVPPAYSTPGEFTSSNRLEEGNNTYQNVTQSPRNLDWCIETRTCQDLCPKLLPWTKWSPCNCHIRYQHRHCTFPFNEFNTTILAPDCELDMVQEGTCIAAPCFDLWTQWSSCGCGQRLSNRTRRCLNDCSFDDIEYRQCTLQDIDCWMEWETWGECQRPDNKCGLDGVRYRTRFADCSAVKSLAETCPQRFKAEAAKCVDYRCTKLGTWDTWSNWSTVKKCGNSTRRRTRSCVYKEKSVDLWRDISCNSSCFQCIEGRHSYARCSGSKCGTRGCFMQNLTSPQEFQATLKCEKKGETSQYIDNLESEYKDVQCGKMNPWSHWSRCGITCGYRWGKRYRSHTCDLSLEEETLEPCSSVQYFHVQPEWCLEKVKCPDHKQIVGVVPARKKRAPVEGEYAVVIVSGVSLIFFGLLGSVVALDFPFLVSEIRNRVARNLLGGPEADRLEKKKQEKQRRCKCKRH